MRRLLLLLALLLPLAALAQDESDKDFLTRLLEQSLSGGGRAVEIEGFAGALSSEARFDRLTVSDADGAWLVIERASVSWDRAALLRGRVEIASLAAESISLIRWPVRAPATISPEATPFSLPELPVSISVGALDASRVTLGADIAGAAVELALSGQLALGGGEGSAQFAARRIDGGVGVFTIDAGYSNKTRILGVNLDLDEGEGGLAATALGIAGAPALLLTLNGEAPVDSFTAQLALETGGVRRLEGTIAFALGEEAQYSLALSGDISALFLPDYQPFFGDRIALTTTAVRRSNGQFFLSDLSLSSRSLTLDGSARLAPGGRPERIDLAGRLADPDGVAVLLPLSGSATTVASADLSVVYDAEKGDQWTASLGAVNLVRPGFAAASALIQGSGTITQGGDEAPRGFTGEIAYSADGVAFADQSLAAALGSRLSGGMTLSQREQGPFRVRDLRAEGQGIALSANAEISGADETYLIKTDGSFEIQNLERFAVLAGRDLSGSAKASLGGTVGPTDLSFDLWITAETDGLALGLANLDPLLSGPATGSGRIIRDGGGVRIEGLNAQGRSFSAKGAAAVTSKSIEADLLVDLTDLALAVPGLSGPATLWFIARPDGLGATQLDVRATSAMETLALEGTIPDHAPRSFVGAATVSARDLSRFEQLAGIRLGGTGDARIDGRITLDLAEFDLAGAATTSDLRLFDDAFDPLLAGDGQMEIAVQRRAGGRVDIPSLSVATSGLAFSGGLVRQDGASQAEFSGKIPDIGLLAEEFGGPIEAQGAATLGDDARWTLQGVSVSGPGGLRAQIDGTLDEALEADLRLSGALPLGLLNRVLEPRRAAGMASFDLSLKGALDSATLSRLGGTVRLADGRLADPVLGQSLERVNGSINLENGAVRVDLSGESSIGGTARLSGAATVSAPFPADLSLAVSGWRLRDPSLYDTSLDGAVTIRGPLEGGAMIAGEVRVGATELRVPSSSISALGDIPDISHIAASPVVLATLSRAGLTKSGAAGGGGGAPYGLDLRIFAPEKVFVRGRGLDAEMGGSLTLGGTTADVVPVGYLGLIRGRLDILQQRFDLTEGAAEIRGDFMPDIRLTAATTARSGTATNLTIEGPLDAPLIILSSTPELPQDEIISQLLFGRSIDQISPLQAVKLASAVATLAGRGGAGLVDNLRRRFGLDDLDISSDPEGDTTFRVGKYLGENLYSDVSVSSGGQSEISLNLDLSDTLTAKGSVDSLGQTSLGIFYERDY